MITAWDNLTTRNLAQRELKLGISRAETQRPQRETNCHFDSFDGLGINYGRNFRILALLGMPVLPFKLRTGAIVDPFVFLLHAGCLLVCGARLRASGCKNAGYGAFR
jgi:hypothetical protein